MCFLPGLTFHHSSPSSSPSQSTNWNHADVSYLRYAIECNLALVPSKLATLCHDSFQFLLHVHPIMSSAIKWIHPPYILSGRMMQRGLATQPQVPGLRQWSHPHCILMTTSHGQLQELYLLYSYLLLVIQLPILKCSCLFLVYLNSNRSQINRPFTRIQDGTSSAIQIVTHRRIPCTRTDTIQRNLSSISTILLFILINFKCFSKRATSLRYS